MKLPDICPHCKQKHGEINHIYWIIRTKLDYDSDVDDQIEDQIYECSNCHTLFRLRWKLESFNELKEVSPK